MIEHYDGIKIFDECDPSWLERDDAFKWYSRCDAITCSTQALADYIQLLLPDKPVVYIPDRIDFDEHKTIKKEHSKELKSLVWFGYSHNIHYLTKTFKTLLDNELELTVYSDTKIEKPQDFDTLRLKWLKYDYNDIHKNLIKYDAALMPPMRKADDIRGRYKSDNKPRTCMALGLPIVQEPDDIKRLKTKKAREEEAEKNLKVAREKFDVKLSVKEYKKLLSKLKKEKST